MNEERPSAKPPSSEVNPPKSNYSGQSGGRVGGEWRRRRPRRHSRKKISEVQNVDKIDNSKASNCKPDPHLVIGPIKADTQTANANSNNLVSPNSTYQNPNNSNFRARRRFRRPKKPATVGEPLSAEGTEQKVQFQPQVMLQRNAPDIIISTTINQSTTIQQNRSSFVTTRRLPTSSPAVVKPDLLPSITSLLGIPSLLSMPTIAPPPFFNNTPPFSSATQIHTKDKIKSPSPHPHSFFLKTSMQQNMSLNREAKESNKSNSNGAIPPLIPTSNLNIESLEQKHRTVNFPDVKQKESAQNFSLRPTRQRNERRRSRKNKNPDEITSTKTSESLCNLKLSSSKEKTCQITESKKEDNNVKVISSSNRQAMEDTTNRIRKHHQNKSTIMLKSSEKGISDLFPKNMTKKNESVCQRRAAHNKRCFSAESGVKDSEPKALSTRVVPRLQKSSKAIKQLEPKNHVDNDKKSAAYDASETSEKVQTKKSATKLLPSTKVVVRRLPPNLTKDQFLAEVPSIPAYNYFVIENATRNPDYSYAPYSTVWINFLSTPEAVDFIDRVGQQVFYDEGDKYNQEYFPSPDFALFQRVPTRIRENKNRGKLELSEDYQKFIKQLEEGGDAKYKGLSVSEMVEDIIEKEHILRDTRAPLVEHILMSTKNLRSFSTDE